MSAADVRYFKTGELHGKTAAFLRRPQEPRLGFNPLGRASWRLLDDCDCAVVPDNHTVTLPQITGCHRSSPAGTVDASSGGR